jgi:hypothetical protein
MKCLTIYLAGGDESAIKESDENIRGKDPTFCDRSNVPESF